MVEQKNRSDTQQQHQKSGGLAKFVWAFFAGLALLTFTGFCCFYFFVTKPIRETAEAPIRKLGDAMSKILGKKVAVSGSTVTLEKSEIGELAVVQRKTQAITKYETRWLGSNKVLIVRCDFLVKAGFDLSGGAGWELLPDKILDHSPRASILSVEPVGEFEIYFSESGTLNKLNSEDHANAFNTLKKQAREDAEQSDIIEEAEAVLRRRLQDRMGVDYLPVERLP